MLRWRALLPLGALMAFFLGLYSFLPSTGVEIYASPDETAHAVMTAEIARHGRAYIQDPQIFEVPWLHPRSWVGVGSRAVPVGFLGWSIFLVPWFWIFGAKSLPWIGALVLISGIWPFFQLVRAHLKGPERQAYWAAWLASVLVWSFPAFILYGNRSLFANGPVLVGFLWSCWLMYTLRSQPAGTLVSRWRYALMGGLVGLTLTIRPVELIWMAPWWLWFAWPLHKQISRQQLAWVVGGFVLAVLPAAILAAQAYGAWFTMGYWQHERAVSSVGEVFVPEGASAAPSASLFASFLPFGFHPRHIWWNISSFFFTFLAPWIWPSVILACYALFRWFSMKKWQQETAWKSLIPLALAAWSIGWLLIIYGSGLYTDHIRVGAVTVGNSFLRYLMPLTCLLGLMFAMVFMRAARSWQRYGLVVIVLMLAGMGIFRAFFADDESLRYTRAELLRYQAIRATAVEHFSPHAVIFSDRSDKVFFPVLRAVSPMPAAAEIARLSRLSVEIGLFTRPLSQAQKDKWQQAGFQVQDIGPFGRERLYKLLTPSP